MAKLAEHDKKMQSDCDFIDSQFAENQDAVIAMLIEKVALVDLSVPKVVIQNFEETLAWTE